MRKHMVEVTLRVPDHLSQIAVLRYVQTALHSWRHSFPPEDAFFQLGQRAITAKHLGIKPYSGKGRA